MKFVMMIALALAAVQARAAENFLVYCHSHGIADAGKAVRVVRTGSGRYLMTVGDVWIGGEKNLVTESAVRTVNRMSRLETFTSASTTLRLGPVSRGGVRTGHLVTDRKTRARETHRMDCSVSL